MTDSPSTTPFSTAESRVSYGIGLQVGKQLSSNRFDGMDYQALAQGVVDALEGNTPAVAEADLQQSFADIRERIEAQEAEQAKTLAVKGQAFLEENAKKDGITVTESGLQYEILHTGEGETPNASATVRTHYHGTLIDGTVFDSSVDRGQPTEFPVNGVIAGWTEALQLMPVGSKWRLYVPHNLAYGERGAGASIAPYSALIFEVELLDIVA